MLLRRLETKVKLAAPGEGGVGHVTCAHCGSRITEGQNVRLWFVEADNGGWKLRPVCDWCDQTVVPSGDDGPSPRPATPRFS